MALPLPQGKQIHIVHRLRSGEYSMPSMEAASDHYELSFIISGDRRIVTPTMTYNLHAGYVNVLAPFQYHKALAASDSIYENYLVKVTPEFLKPFTDRLGTQILDRICQYPPKTFDEETRNRVFHIAEDMYQIYMEFSENEEKKATDPTKNRDMTQDYVEYKLQNLLYTILLIIYEKAHSEELGSIHTTSLSQPIMEAVYYIEANYMKPIKIEDVAAISGYSISYFSRVFQNQLGNPFSEYLTTIRLKHVQDSLITTDKSITEIALENGFSYPGNMTNSFRHAFGMTPLQYRKNRNNHKQISEVTSRTKDTTSKQSTSQKS